MPPSPAKPAKGKKSVALGFIEPSLATLRAAPPTGAGWVHELKFDGYRLQAHIRRHGVKLLTRSGLDWTAKFGASLAAAFADMPVDEAIVDGELVAENASGAPDFSMLQDAIATARTDRLVFYAFDLLYLQGRDVRELPLIERRAALAGIVIAPGIIRYSEDFPVEGARLLRHVCRLGLEGVVSKRSNAPYRSGRVKDWIKAKCSLRQEFVVAGYVPSSVSTKMIGALVLGYYQAGKLIHAGRVGTGFSHKVAGDLLRLLEPMAIPNSPVAAKLAAVDARGVRFVRPQLVAEIEFRAWTAEGFVRHASYRGLREDKPAGEVVRESGSV